MILLVQNNCSKVPQYSSKTPLEYSQMLNYYQTRYKTAMYICYDNRLGGFGRDKLGAAISPIKVRCFYL